MGRGAERAPQAVRRLVLRFRPGVVERRVRSQLAAVREYEGVQRCRMPVLRQGLTLKSFNSAECLDAGILCL